MTIITTLGRRCFDAASAATAPGAAAAAAPNVSERRKRRLEYLRIGKLGIWHLPS
ncbi:MAG: hypothetical protein J7M21_01520 [Planctomycetes bacterium]|nr:hypothetical protein [Planctomycetota bacterium]